LYKWFECEIQNKRVQKIKYNINDIGYKRFSIGFNIVEANINRDKILIDADRIISGYYQIYDYELYKADKVNWSIDPISNFKCKNNIYHGFISANKLIMNNIDIKNYWEQSNQHWLVTLGQAYILSGKEKYANKILEMILDWSYNNKLGCSINWKCTMDVSIRVCNWIAALSCIEDSSNFKKYSTRIYTELYKHMIYISKNLENKSKYTNNHYISNLIGLIWSSVYLTNVSHHSSQLSTILDFAFEELSKQCNMQILDDGMSYEMSTYYHLFVTEMIVHTILMLDSNNIEYPIILKKYANKMIHVCLLLTENINKIPVIGDQDGSRLFHINGCFNIDRNDFSYIINLSRNAHWYHKIDNHNLYNSGVFILKNKNQVCYIKCGQIGTGGKGTHDHNDHLSFVYYKDGNPIIIDPGTGCYTNNRKLRNIMRSTRMHNTLYLNNIEQNIINESQPFNLCSNNKSECEFITKNEFIGLFRYPPEIGVMHRRKIVLNGDILEITDEVKCSKDNFNLNKLNPVLQLIFPFELGSMDFDNSKIVINSEKRRYLIDITPYSHPEVEPCKVSPSYGIFTEGYKLIIPIKYNVIKICISTLY